jgi:hypothetical protein
MTIGMTGSFRVLKRHHIVNHGGRPTPCATGLRLPHSSCFSTRVDFWLIVRALPLLVSQTHTSGADWGLE